MRLNRRDFLKTLGAAVGGLFVLTRSNYRAQSEQILLANDTEDSSGATGTITDIVTGRPIAGALVSVTGNGTATTDSTGVYNLPLPPGTYEIQVQATGFMDMSRVQQDVSAAAFLTADFEMVPLNTTEEEDRIIYDKLVSTPQSPLEDVFPEPEPLTPKDIAPAVVVPSTIKVLWNGTIQEMLLEDYLKGVVPYEMPASWPIEALKAQAIAARTYAVAYVQSRPYICTTSACQVYGDARYASTNAAVDATYQQVATKYDGTIISALYSSRCNGRNTLNSEDAVEWRTCEKLGWNYVYYLRRKSCWGHSPYSSSCGYYGHGVGMCQYGAQARANEGWDYARIITYYYTDIRIQGTPPPPPVPQNPTNGQFITTATSVTLSWSAPGSTECYAEAQRVGGGYSSQFGWAAATSWTLGALPQGKYQWRVKGRNNAREESDYSQYSYFIIADRVYKEYFPRVDKNSTAR